MTKRGLIVFLTALFVVAAFGSAFAVQSNGMTSNNGLVGSNALPLPQAANTGLGNDFAGGFTAGLDVHVNPDGLGDTLIYNYFNARSGMGTYFSVVNTSDSYIRARVRFHEARNISGSTCNQGSWEILDFDICLTPWDVWTAWVQKNGNRGAVCSGDTHTKVYDGVDGTKSFVALTGGASATIGCANFKTAAEGAQAGITEDDTLEGYWTIIGETLLDGTPYTCDPAADLNVDVPNVLFGSALIADLSDPTNSPFYEYNATALADFASAPVAGAFGAGTEQPTLEDGGDLLRGVNYALTKEHLYGTYLLDATGGQWETEYVVMFPTKRYTVGTSCDTNIFVPDTVNITKYDLDENPELPTGCSFSPCKTNPQDHIPNEVNVITVSKTGTTPNQILTSTVRLSGIITTPFERGWIDINMNNDADSRWTDATDATGTYTTHGWPVLGLQLLNNKNYSGATPMHALTNVTHAAPVIP